MIATIIFIVIAYLCGSLSSAIIICKLMGLPDPRTEGSNNPGATNVLRIGGKLPAILVLVGDILKGLLPVLLASLFHIKGFALGIVALAAIAGHIFPVFFKFKGGKGVATFFGAIAGLSLLFGIVCAIAWGMVAVIFRYSSVAALVAVGLAVLCTLVIGPNAYFLPVLIIAGLIVWRHSANIKRLRAGTETKIKL